MPKKTEVEEVIEVVETTIEETTVSLERVETHDKHEEKTTGVTFNDRNLRPTILESLNKKGYTKPTPIQELTFKHFSEGHHLVGQSQTGSGKTAAFLLPVLNAMNLKEAAPQILILAPTRELALQTEEEAFELTRGLFGAKSCLVCGGMSFFKQKQRVQSGANIIVGTPGRIYEMLEKKIIQTNQLKYFILDEVDRMLDMGFEDEVEAIWSLLPHKMQVMCFSATMPRELITMFGKYLPEGYQHIQIEKEKMTVDQLDHAFVRVAHNQKVANLEAYLKRGDYQKVVVFAQTKRNVAELYETLRTDEYKTLELHGDIDQYGRMRATKEFKMSTKVILVATDVASRGLNFNDVDLVVNFDMPQDPEDYIHRVGRTARAGKSGKAIMFVGHDEDRKLRMLEKANKMQIKEVDLDDVVIPRKQEESRFGGGGSFQRRRRSGGGRSSGGYGGGRSGGGSRFGGGERRTYGDRPAGGGERRAYGDRPAGGERRAYGDRPAGGERRAYGDRPAGGERRAYGDRPTGGGERRAYGDRTAGGERRPYGDRTAGGERRSYDRNSAPRRPSTGGSRFSRE